MDEPSEPMVRFGRRPIYPMVQYRGRSNQMGVLLLNWLVGLVHTTDLEGIPDWLQSRFLADSWVVLLERMARSIHNGLSVGFAVGCGYKAGGEE